MAGEESAFQINVHPPVLLGGIRIRAVVVVIEEIAFAKSKRPRNRVGDINPPKRIVEFGGPLLESFSFSPGFYGCPCNRQ